MIYTGYISRIVLSRIISWTGHVARTVDVE